MANRGENRQEEDDVDSFFLPGGILDFLNHDSADSLLSSIGLDSRASHESRVLSMTAADHEPVQDSPLLDLPDPQALSSTGTNPNAKEFVPYPVHYDEYIPQPVGLHAPLPAYPQEPALHWTPLAPAVHEPRHVPSNSFVFDGPELIAPEGLSALVGFQHQHQQQHQPLATPSMLAPERPVDMTSFEQPRASRPTELLPAHQVVSAGRFEFDMSSKASDLGPRPTVSRHQYYAAVAGREDNSSFRFRTSHAPSVTASPASTSTTAATAASVVAAPAPKYPKSHDRGFPHAFAQSHSTSSAGHSKHGPRGDGKDAQQLQHPQREKEREREREREREKDLKAKQDRTRRQSREQHQKDPSSSTSFFAVSSNQVRNGQAPPAKGADTPPLPPHTAALKSGAQTTAPSVSGARPQHTSATATTSTRPSHDAVAAASAPIVDHRPASLKIPSHTSDTSKLSKDNRPRAATEEAPQVRHQQLQGSPAAIAQSIPRTEAASPQGPDSMPESEWEPLPKLAAATTPIADRSSSAKQKATPTAAPTASTAGVRAEEVAQPQSPQSISSANRAQAMMSASATTTTAAAPKNATATATTAAAAAAATGNEQRVGGKAGASSDSEAMTTARADGNKSPRHHQHQQASEAMSRQSNGRTHKRSAKEHPHQRQKHRNKHQQPHPQQPQSAQPVATAQKPAQPEASSAEPAAPTPARNLFGTAPTYRTAYQYVLPLQRALLAVCDRAFNVQSKTTLVSLLAAGLSEAMTLFVCLLALLLAGLLSALVFALQLHEYAVAKIMSDYYVAFCFAFPYSFSVLVNYVAQWAPHWAPVCLWYSFLVQVFCTSQENGTTSSYAAIFRVLIPLLFIAEGVTSESYLMYLDGSELLLLSFLLSGLKLECVSTPLFLLTWAVQVVCVAIFGPRPLLQYCQLVFSLTALHLISADSPKNHMFAVRRSHGFDDNAVLPIQDDASQSA